MVSQKKKDMAKGLKAQLSGYPVVGVLDMHKLPARQLHEIRNKLRGRAVIRMAKKRVMSLVLKEQGMETLDRYIQGEPALLLSKENPFAIAKVLQASTSEAAAKAGDVAPREIVIKAGPTPLAPGPVIGQLQKLKIPAGVEGERIAVKKDTVLARQGEVITPEMADILFKLGIKPMEISLNLVAVLEKGLVYEKSILFVPAGHYFNQITQAASRAFSLSVAIRFFTPQTTPFLLSKASQEAQSLAREARILTPETVVAVLMGSQAEATELEKKLQK